MTIKEAREKIKDEIGEEEFEIAGVDKMSWKDMVTFYQDVLEEYVEE